MELQFATKCIYGDKENMVGEPTGAISFPIYQTATYAHPEVGKSTGFDYSRLQNPTREQLEKVVAQLEEGIDAFALSTGMAAISLSFEIFNHHVILRKQNFIQFCEHTVLFNWVLFFFPLSGEK